MLSLSIMFLGSADGTELLSVIFSFKWKDKLKKVQILPKHREESRCIMQMFYQIKGIYAVWQDLREKIQNYL